MSIIIETVALPESGPFNFEVKLATNITVTANEARHVERSRDGACLPACARMGLAFWGDERTETALAAQLKTKSFRTPIFN